MPLLIFSSTCISPFQLNVCICAIQKLFSNECAVINKAISPLLVLYFSIRFFFSFEVIFFLTWFFLEECYKVEWGRNFQLKCLNSFYKCKIVYCKRNKITFRCQNAENNLIKGYFEEFTTELGKIALSIRKHEKGVLNKSISLKFKYGCIIVTFQLELANLRIIFFIKW